MRILCQCSSGSSEELESSCENSNNTYSGSNGWLIGFCFPWNDFSKDFFDYCEKEIVLDPLMY